MSTSEGEEVVLTELIRHHCELLVHPLLWPSRPLEMIGCRFRHVDNVSQIELPQDEQQLSEEQTEEAGSIARFLSASFSLQVKLNAISKILLSNDSILDKRCRGFDFFFDGRPVHSPNYRVFYRNDQLSKPVCQEPLLMIGYLNYTNVTGSRWRKVEPRQPRHEQNNTAVRRSSLPTWDKFNHFSPKEWKEDPYFVCVLLSLAQFQKRRSLKPQKRTSYSSRLLVANSKDDEFIHIYEARISSVLLELLDKPTSTTIKAILPAIEHRQIPYKPFETFQKRILSALSLHVPVGTGPDVIDQRLKRPHEGEDDDSRKRSRTSCMACHI